ncbi:lytic transglycosylase domain-containing protein [Thalassovita sp.]|uniref:lytic transglycosylase domain-containing protein n=1 Tax=Thalassovita sp. TaxID=1979401 RepID=UPI0029DE5CE5|nr:lytic transglycosylase domain-containing protein [Thalassovita sp.]
MFRALALILAVCVTDSPALAEGPQPIASALEAARAGNWANADTIAARAGPVGSDLLTWVRLRAGEGTFDEVQAFAARRADWPGLSLMRKRAEARLDGVPPARVLDFFGKRSPQTGAGVLALAKALTASGRKSDAEAAVVQAWRTMDLDGDSHDALVAGWGKALAPHHKARLDMALWRDLRGDARKMLPLVGDDWRKLAEARIGLRAQDKGVDGLIAAVPAGLQGDPGLAYERFLWRVRKGRTADAVTLIEAQSKTAAGLGKPAEWSGWRRYLVRDLMREGEYKTAYRIASAHHMTAADGYGYADLEWLAGYLSLRFLDAPERALDHFQRFRAAVETPISLGRAGYWIGRTQEALGDREGAAIAYAEGAKYQTSFYGLLAAERGGVAFDASLAGAEAFPAWRSAAFTRSDVYQAGILALNAGEVSLAEQFFVHLAGGLDRTGLGQMGEMAAELEQPHLQVMIAKEAAQKGITIAAPYYALHPMRKMKLPVPTEMALSIARRESEFDPTVISGAGAQGLMQLMPGTAAQMARELGVDHDPGRVLGDWSYNATLGSAYLAKLADRFGGNVVMVAAGYNAGPGRPNQWIERFGDPRAGGVDVVDWIEMIPFTETQNYVMRVAESLPVYRARLGLTPHPVPFSRELTGATVLRR